VPIDPSTEPAAATTRRTFLVRSAMGGALVTAGALASPLGSLLPTAGAQVGTSDLLSDEDFAAFAAPLELAAVQAYLTAVTSGTLTDQPLEWARLFARNHQSVADLLSTLIAEGEPAPRADATLSAQLTSSLEAAADVTAIAAVLAELEETIAATHLSAVEALADSTTALTVAQVAAVESQQAALMGSLSGTSIEELTPMEASLELALSPSDAEAEATTTTTEAGGDATTTTAAN
jgi:hypothetical protein